MREIENIFVESLDDYMNEMVPRLGFQRNPIYRGQSTDQWKLEPMLFRKGLEKSEFKTWAELEGALLLSLKQKSRGELGYEPMSELEWMSIGEHHGLPTRFSSWSENALVALFFATEPNCDDDGVVWRILPGDADFVISQDYEQVPERPKVYLPQKTTPAMLNQKTCYLSHPLPDADEKAPCFEDYFERSNDRLHLARIVIPSTEKEYIRRRLATMGFDYRTLFPGMSGLCAQIREEVYSHTDSFEWVFPEEA